VSPESVGEDELRKQIEAAEAALDSRADLAEYREHGNHRLLFALELYTKTTDIRGIATDALVDGLEDKSIDLLYVDSKSNVAYLMQGYQSQGKKTVPYDKAKELFQAIGWALASGGSPVPARIAPAVAELHRALTAGTVTTLELWLVHNLPESDLHDEELAKARAMAESLLRDNWPGKEGEPIAVVSRQVGSRTLAEWYKASHTPILVSDRYEVPIVDCYTEQAGSPDPSESWRCVVTSVDADWLRQLAWQHGERLLSANVRSYMGRRTPVNQGIQSTISDRPDRLLVYHNGVTALVNKFELEPATDGAPPRLVIEGISIVNGAQTVGSISRLGPPVKQRQGKPAQAPKIGGRLPIRFIECPNREILLEIIRYNNMQNPTEPTDFRSNDRTQHRLIDEFRDQYGIPYDGARRGHLEEGRLARPKGTISANTVGRILAAFHGDPDIAYFRQDEIWEHNEQYARVFPDRITATHVLFCYSLYEAIETARRRCARAVAAGGDRDDGDIHAYFANRGAVWLLLAAIGRSIDTILGSEHSHDDHFTLSFHADSSLPEAVAAWEELLESFLAFAAQSLSEVFRELQGLRDTVLVGKQIDDFRHTIKGKRGPGRALAPECDKFAQLIAP
jgi:hypothetical protein